MDPIAGRYPELTPYQFASNKPINSIDIDGLEVWEEVLAGYTLYEAGAALFVAGASTIIVHQVITHPTHIDNPFAVRFRVIPESVVDKPAETPPVPMVYIKPDIKPKPDEKPKPTPTSPLVQNDEDDDKITLYRGVSQSQGVYYTAAKKGIAVPKGYLQGDAHSDPEMHQIGDNYSIFTSWTKDRSVAVHFSKGAGTGGRVPAESGVILTKTFKKSEVIKAPLETIQENEYLVPGVVTGAKVESNGVAPPNTAPKQLLLN